MDLTPDQQEMAEQFVSLSGTDMEFATSFLQGVGWSLDTATEAFLGGGAPPVRNTTSTNNGSSSSSGDAATGAGPSAADIAKIAADQGVDLETARAIASVQGESAAANGGVRAPIQPKRQRLFDGPGHGGGGGGGGRGMPMGMGTEFGMGAGFGAGGPNTHSRFRNFESEFSGVGSDEMLRLTSRMSQSSGRMSVDQLGSRYRMATSGGGGSEVRGVVGGSGSGAGGENQLGLGKIFAPPVDLMFQGNIAAARRCGKEEKKWLLVNIQNDHEFMCHVLNRDLWTDDMVSEIVQSNFVFFQRDSSTQDGQAYIQLYKPPTPFPHVAILDPRTGEMLQIVRLPNKENPERLRERFLEEVTTFLDQSSMEPGAPPPVSRVHLGNGSGNGGGNSMGQESSNSVDDQLAAAIEASLLDSHKPPAPGQQSNNSKSKSKPKNGGAKSPAGRRQSTAFEVDDDDDDAEYVYDDDEDGVDDYDDVAYDSSGGGDVRMSVGNSAVPSTKTEEPDVVAVAAPVVPAKPVKPTEILKAEPAEGQEGCTTVTIRLSTGKRVKRRFREDDTVSQVFLYVRSVDEQADAAAKEDEGEEEDEGGFDLLMYPNISLREMDQAMTLKDANVLNTSMNIRLD